MKDSTRTSTRSMHSGKRPSRTSSASDTRVPAKEFEFTGPEVSCIKAAIQTWESYGVKAYRRWLEPLLCVLVAADSVS